MSRSGTALDRGTERHNDPNQVLPEDSRSSRVTSGSNNESGGSFPPLPIPPPPPPPPLGAKVTTGSPYAKEKGAAAKFPTPLPGQDEEPTDLFSPASHQISPSASAGLDSISVSLSADSTNTGPTIPSAANQPADNQPEDQQPASSDQPASGQAQGVAPKKEAAKSNLPEEVAPPEKPTTWSSGTKGLIGLGVILLLLAAIIFPVLAVTVLPMTVEAVAILSVGCVAFAAASFFVAREDFKKDNPHLYTDPAPKKSQTNQVAEPSPVKSKEASKDGTAPTTPPLPLRSDSSESLGTSSITSNEGSVFGSISSQSSVTSNSSEIHPHGGKYPTVPPGGKKPIVPGVSKTTLSALSGVLPTNSPPKPPHFSSKGGSKSAVQVAT